MAFALRSLRSPNLLAFAPVAFAALAGHSAPVLAQDQSGAVQPQKDTPPVTQGATGVSAAEPIASDHHDHRDPKRFAYFDSLSEPGQTTNYPGTIDSVLGDVGGFRSWLADHDTGLQARLGLTVTADLLDTGQPRNPQRFNGQRPTLQLQTGNFTTTTSLRSIGLPNTKLLLGAGYLLTSFENNGPSRAWVRTVGVYQSFANGKIELKAGFMPNYFEYVGFYTGGSPVLSNGIAGTLPIQAGLSADPTPTPLVNLTLHGDHGLYVKVGVQRSVSPKGSVYDARHGSFGIKFSQDGAGPLTIGEIGIRRPASKNGKQIWLRAGGFYNNSDYTRFDGKGTQSNKVAYGLADLQLTQPYKSEPARGLYVGGSAYWADPKVATITQTYEGRVYDIGFLPSRPKDSITARVTYNKYSDDAQAKNRRAGLVANNYQLTSSISYSYHVASGIYVTPALSYIVHPSFIGAYKDALNAVATVYFLL